MIRLVCFSLPSHLSCSISKCSELTWGMLEVSGLPGAESGYYPGLLELQCWKSPSFPPEGLCSLSGLPHPSLVPPSKGHESTPVSYFILYSGSARWSHQANQVADKMREE